VTIARFRLMKYSNAALVMIALCAPPLAAPQGQPRTPAPRNSSVDLRVRDREMGDRSIALDRIGKENKAVAELVEKLKSDFRRLQTIDNDMMREVSASLYLDYAKIGDAAGEMNQCAKRLKANMPALTTSDVDKSPGVRDGNDERQFKASLVRLDSAVSSFVNSMSVVEAKNSGKAASDLNSVIQLSDSVKRSAKKLSKQAEKR
jgi:hypothetical protein